MYCFALRTAARYSGRRKLEVTFSCPRFLAFDGFFGRSAATDLSSSRRVSLISRTAALYFARRLPWPSLKIAEVRLDHGSEFTVDSFPFTMKRNLLLHHLRLARVRLLFGAECGHHGAPHGGFGRTLFGPDFPLSDALRKKHLHAGDGSDSFLRGELQELSSLRAVDQVH